MIVTFAGESSGLAAAEAGFIEGGTLGSVFMGKKCESVDDAGIVEARITTNSFNIAPLVMAQNVHIVSRAKLSFE